MAAAENGLPKDTLVQLVLLLNQQLADAIDLQSQLNQACWNVSRTGWLPNLLHDAAEGVASDVDLIAKRIPQLGGVAQATVRAATANSRLAEYPPALVTGSEHLEAVADALVGFGQLLRATINETVVLGDANTTEILTGISRRIDQWLWFVRAHFPSTW